MERTRETAALELEAWAGRAQDEQKDVVYRLWELEKHYPAELIDPIRKRLEEYRDALEEQRERFIEAALEMSRKGGEETW